MKKKKNKGRKNGKDDIEEKRLITKDAKKL
jgi:hypothetical protein